MYKESPDKLFITESDRTTGITGNSPRALNVVCVSVTEMILLLEIATLWV